MIAQNLLDIQVRIAAAAQAAGRNPSEITLLAVSKTKPVAAIAEALAAGQLDFGENYPQELREKQPQLPQVRWHFIGHLQSNKVKYIAPFVHLIHSVDSDKLLAEIDKQAAKAGRTIDCLLQIHISGEATKSGMTEAEAENLLERATEFPHIRICGLMGMAALTDDEQLIRAQFRQLKHFFDALQKKNSAISVLSMGMSSDMEIAISEGSTMVRVGSAIFGDRHYP